MNDRDIEIVHLRYDLSRLQARMATLCEGRFTDLATIAQEALQCDRPHVAQEKLDYLLQELQNAAQELRKG